MNSIVNLFSNFKEFYSEINGATLTGAIDVVVVEQPDGSFVSSPFHVRFGKLGVLRSREKVVDIEVNGEPVDLQMKLGESGEAFFVEECAEDDSEVPAHMATSPIPSHSYLSNYEETVQQRNDGPGGPIFKALEANEATGGAAGGPGAASVVGPTSIEVGEGGEVMKMVSSQTGAGGDGEEELLPRLRRNSVDLSNENAEVERAKFENQRSEYSHRRHTDNLTNRPDLSLTKKEYTTQKLRQELNAAAEAAEQEQIFHMEGLDDGGALEGGVAGEEQQVMHAGEWKNSTPLPSGAGDHQLVEDKHFKPIDAQPTTGQATEIVPMVMATAQPSGDGGAADSKSKKKRRKKSLMKKKNTQRKNSASSSSGAGSNHSDPNEGTETDSLTASQVTVSSASGSSLPKEDAADGGDVDQQVPDVSSPLKKEGNDSPALGSTAMTSSHHADLDIHFFSDTDIGTGVSPQQSRPSTPIQSDTEFEISQREKPVSEEERLMYGNSWNWGELPTQVEPKAGDAEAGKQAQHNSMLTGLMSLMKYNNKKKRQSVPDGMYLSDLDKLTEPEIAQLYFPSFSKLKQQQQQHQGKRGSGGSGDDEDRESGNGTSIPQSPTSMEDGPGGKDSDFEERDQLVKSGGDGTVDRSIDSFALSLCGGLSGADDSAAGPTDEQFERHRLQYDNVLSDPSVFKSPDLVVRINGKYYSWEVACPQVMTILAFRCGLPNEFLASATKPKADDGLPVADNKKGEEQSLQQQTQPQPIQQPQPAGGSWWRWRRSNESKPPAPAGTPQTPITPTAAAEESPDGLDMKTSAAVGTQTSRSNSPDDESHEGGMDATVPTYKNASKTEDGYNGSLSSEDSELAMEKSMSAGGMLIDNSSEKTLFLLGCGEKYRKTLRLSSERIKELNLLDGMNEIEFSVTTAYQGTTRCKCYLFKWKHNDKVVISDIDGTITKSDVLGHILPMVGKSWDQIGVAQLFSKIEENGYKMLYLSARAIGQAKTTRGYLQSIRQGDVKLPDGPLLLNPTSLMSAFHREVIEKKPEQFKIACLNDIRDLFPERNPFYAGYGNRINDVWAYRAVGIPTSRIFTINPKGELKHELTQTFQSTYAGQSLMVNDYFPRIERESPESEFSDRDEDDDDYDEDDDDDDDDYEPLQFAIETSGDEQQQPHQQQEEQHLQKPTIRIKRSPKSGFADYRPSDCDVIIL
ncbi:phosphatidate phosphatase LPIN3 isoform X1 [Anopheles merus]|uniref:phosphatidate phosphatase LPIN3 isoform X1 n=1 Tax=Anopheles merus TaxID=30066 RepID=UPI001BE4295F|nr:phosphatidate phosphatase LPIN3 isoform X1 [Anopheles merus]XP_041772157.1 phosphatidate phosphatase LPIN3 isoform X1 [Anopheles merus]XP_041772158.1 phosphatidate phosphatase LPIN3 isoform X1 [Anopheles merus]